MIRKGNPNPTRIKARELVPGDIVEVSSKRGRGEEGGRKEGERGRERGRGKELIFIMNTCIQWLFTIFTHSLSLSLFLSL